MSLYQIIIIVTIVIVIYYLQNERWSPMKKNKKLERLPDAELDIMLVLWDADKPLAKSKITELLKDKRNWSVSTVQVLLTRLTNKSFVELVKEKRFNFYKAIVSEGEYKRYETKTFIERMHENSFKNLIATLVENKTITKDDIDEIADIIRKADKDD